MAASTVDIPAITLNGGPMLDGWHDGELVGSGTVIWRSRRLLGAGEIDEEEFIRRASDSAPSLGHCNTMGTASTMNAITEALGMSLPGNAAIPAPYRERAQMAYETGRRIVDMAYEDLRPSKILTREAFLNAIRLNAAIGGSTNAQPHIVAMARHAGVEIGTEDWMEHGYDVPLLVNMQPAGQYLSERFHRAGGVPAVMWELLQAGKLDGSALTCTGRTQAENLEGREATDREVIFPYSAPLKERAGFLVLTGNLFDFAIMKTSVISRRIPHSAICRGRARRRVRGTRDRVRRLRRLSRPDQRSVARHRRELHPRDPRLGPARLAGLGRSREHAAARRAAPARHHEPADARRRAAVGHVGQPVDPQRLARKRRRRRTRLAAHRRHRSASISTPARCDALVERRGDRAAQGRSAAAGSAEQYAVGGALSREDRASFDGRRPRVRGQVSRHVKRRRRGTITEREVRIPAPAACPHRRG